MRLQCDGSEAKRLVYECSRATMVGRIRHERLPALRTVATAGGIISSNKALS